MPKREQTRWGVCFGVVGALVIGGAAVATMMPQSAQADAASGVVAQPQLGQGTPTPTQQGNQLAAGRQRYDRACGRCHPGGEEDIGPRVSNKNWEQARMVKQIRQGSGRMKAIPPAKLPEADMPALMVYLRSIHAVR